jgi:hypothetical protein
MALRYTQMFSMLSRNTAFTVELGYDVIEGTE